MKQILYSKNYTRKQLAKDTCKLTKALKEHASPFLFSKFMH